MATTFLAPSTTTNSFDVSRQHLNMNSPSDFLQSKSPIVSHGFSTRSNDWERCLSQKANDPYRSNASALDALATLASNTISSSDNDFKAMPPPPPRRMRSASNPEGMEKWDSYRKSSRCHFVLPSSILEEELASANVACQVHDEQMARDKTSLLGEHNGPIKKRGLTVFQVDSQWLDDRRKQQQLQQQEVGASPTTVISSSSPEGPEDSTENTSVASTPEDLEDEKDLEPEELLRRARSKLLEDLAIETNVQKSVLPLPHDLHKYKSLYNKNGRIGIYTPLERAAIITKFNKKRGRRVWNKKIRYNCRKNLADRRMRVKGRFVKRAVEQNATKPVRDKGSGSSTRTSSPVSSCSPSVTIDVTPTFIEGEDVDMPDVDDPEAGFRPTASQPYRRVRRHTIT